MSMEPFNNRKWNGIESHIALVDLFIKKNVIFMLNQLSKIVCLTKIHYKYLYLPNKLPICGKCCFSVLPLFKTIFF